jgi:hypothetical protein
LRCGFIAERCEEVCLGGLRMFVTGNTRNTSFRSTCQKVVEKEAESWPV